MEQIEKWNQFCYNFPYYRDWIMAIWPGELGEHFCEKFSSLYKKYDSRGVMLAFCGELTIQNRMKLYKWVLNEWN